MKKDNISYLKTARTLEKWRNAKKTDSPEQLWTRQVNNKDLMMNLDGRYWSGERVVGYEVGESL